MLEEHGILLYLNGNPSNSKSIAKACHIAEEGFYMRDYIGNSDGKISGISFDFISTQQ